jgi:hypothetical protein
MPFEHESLVGYLYLVGGRAISQPPPGALVELAPRRAARGREADTVYLLITPSGEGSASASFYNDLAQTAAAHYFEGTGSVTAGIKSVFNLLNERLIDGFDRARRAAPRTGRLPRTGAGRSRRGGRGRSRRSAVH